MDALDRSMENLRRAQTNLSHALEYLQVVERNRGPSALALVEARKKLEHKAEEINLAAMDALVAHEERKAKAMAFRDGGAL